MSNASIGRGSSIPRKSYPQAFSSRSAISRLGAAGFNPQQSMAIADILRETFDRQAVDERINYTVIEENMGGGGMPTIFVAAGDARPESKAKADVVCPGAYGGDDAAIDSVWDVNGTWGQLVFSEGTFYTENGITGAFANIRGCGYGSTYIYCNGAGNNAIAVTGSEGRVSDLTVLRIGGTFSFGITAPIVENCGVWDFPAGVIADYAEANYISGCDPYGMHVGERGRAIGNYLVDCVTGIRGGFWRAAIVDNVIDNCTRGIRTDADASLLSIIQGNVIRTAQEHGMYVPGTDLVVVGNLVIDAGRATDDTWSGIEGGGDRSLYALNKIALYEPGNMVKYGVNITATGQDCKAFGNDAFGAFVTAGFNDAGAGTDVTAANR